MLNRQFKLFNKSVMKLDYSMLSSDTKLKLMSIYRMDDNSSQSCNMILDNTDDTITYDTGYPQYFYVA